MYKFGIKLKIILLYIIGTFFIILLTSFIFNMVISRNITNQETRLLEQNVKRIETLINTEKKRIESVLKDWAYWDDTYDFLSGSNPKYIDSNLQNDTFETLNINFMYYYDLYNKVKYNKSYYPENALDALGDSEILNYLELNKNLFKFSSEEEIHSGLLFIQGKPFIISLAQVTNSNRNQATNGVMVVGFFLQEDYLDYLMEITQTEISFVTTDNKYILQKDYKTNINNTLQREPNYHYDNFEISGKFYFNDINKDVSICIFVKMNRDGYIDKNSYIKLFIIIFTSLISIMIFVLLYLTDKLLLNRLIRLHNFMKDIASHKDITRHIDVMGSDEIAQLANETNHMLSEIDLAYKEIKANDEQILQISYTDKLTGLYNRAFFENKLEVLDQELNSKYFIIMGDLNGLKLINETFGHKEGDRLLKMFGNKLLELCESDDIIARWGGDEFIILIVGKDKEYVNLLSEKIKAASAKIKDFGYNISVALGNAEKDEVNNEFDLIMHLAEERMYRNKLMEKASERNSTLASLQRSLHEKNKETEEHTRRIKIIGVKLGKKLGLPQEKIDELEILGVLHDIGKIGIPDSILMKTGKLTNDEWDVMKTHSAIGYRIASATHELAHIANSILYHHEKYDGTGYPHGLRGKQIPMLSRILNIVDSFDVMTHKRSYKDALSIDRAINELRACSGTQFDPDFVEVFIKMVSEDEHMLL